jgi:hypothetical protein
MHATGMSVVSSKLPRAHWMVLSHDVLSPQATLLLLQFGEGEGHTALSTTHLNV